MPSLYIRDFPTRSIFEPRLRLLREFVRQSHRLKKIASLDHERYDYSLRTMTKKMHCMKMDLRSTSKAACVFCPLVSLEDRMFYFGKSIYIEELCGAMAGSDVKRGAPRRFVDAAARPGGRCRQHGKRRSKSMGSIVQIGDGPHALTGRVWL